MTLAAVAHADPTDAEAIKGMTYPIQCPDGRWFDRALPRRGTRDPFYGDCPVWCDGEHNSAETTDEDRNHYGPILAVPVRALGCELEDDHRAVIGTAQMYLKRNVLHHEATVWLGKGEAGDGFELSLDEARTIGETLIALAVSDEASK